MPFKKIAKFSPFLVLIILVLVGYYLLPFGFFQQDEWLGLARFLQFKDEGLIAIFQNAFSYVGVHYTPFSTLVIYLLFSAFKLNYPMYAIVSLLFHIVASILFFVLTKIIFGNFKSAFLAMLLFGVSAASFQATAWPIADIGTHGSVIFGFLSLILFLKFIKTSNQKLFVSSLLILIISLLFKENTIGFFALMPVVLFFFGSMSRQKKFKYTLFILLAGFAYFGFRITSAAQIVQSLPQTGSQQQLFKFAYNVFSVPIKASVQSFIPSFQIYDAAHSFTKILNSSITGIPGSPEYEAFVLKRVFEGANFIIFIGIIIVGLVYFKHFDKRSKKIVIFGILFIFLNSLVFVFAPERGGIIYTIDSRNLYLITAGTIIILVTLLGLSKRQKLILVGLFVYLVLNVWWLNKQIVDLVQVGKMRKGILSEIKAKYPVLPKQVVFYTQSDASFYGLPTNERIMPFQSGFGQTLLVWYESTENWPRELFRNKFLWEITDQGYRENEGRGFGYFRDFNMLTRTIEENNIPIESVVAFSYDSQSKEFKDISRELVGRLKGFFTRRGKVSQNAFALEISDNPVKKQFALDGDRETFWDSGVSYKNPMFLDINLVSPRRIAEIELDAYTNKDQNEVGYEVFLSQDGENWESVFYAKRYTPDTDGFVNIYFEPQDARFIRIQQKGYHDYSPWVIHELNIYAAL